MTDLSSFPFLSISILLIVGLCASFLCRKIGLPTITGQIFFGVLLGPSFLNIINHDVEVSLTPITNFAIALIAFTVGTHLNFSRLHNSYQRIISIAILEASLAFFFAFSLFYFFNPLGLDTHLVLPTSLLIASLACATSPASALHVIKEQYAKGIVVKTLIGVIAIDNILCLFTFEVSQAISSSIIANENFANSLFQGFLGIITAIILGSIIGIVLNAITKILANRHKNKKDEKYFYSTLLCFLFISIILLDGLCSYINASNLNIFVSPIIGHLSFGLTIANISKFKDEFLKQFTQFEGIIFICFFTLAGAHLDLSYVRPLIALPFILYILSLVIGKYAGAKIGATISKSPKKIREHIGKTLFVQGGITIGLLWVIGSNPHFSEFSKELSTFILCCVIFTELLGTILIARTLEKAQEVNKDKLRLIDFIEEEFIVPSLFAQDRQETIEALCHFMKKTHKIELTEEELIKNVLEREKLAPTGIGKGVAIPHAKIKMTETDDIKGVFAIADPPIDFGADDEPAHFIILIITPVGNEERHLQIIANISKLLREESIRNQLLQAKTSAEIYDIIHSEEAEEYNHFL